MKTYSVYQHPVHGYKYVKKGFSWVAFFFPIPWALFHKLWSTTALFLVLFFLFSIISEVDETGILEIITTVIICLLAGIEGSKLLEKGLEKRGFTFLADVRAHTKDGAKAEFYQKVNHYSSADLSRQSPGGNL